MSNNAKSDTIKDYLKNPVVMFLIKAAAVYVIWELLNWFQMHNAPFGSIWNGIKAVIRDNIVNMSAGILRLLGYDLIQYGAVVIIEGSAGVEVGPACVGFGLLFGFAGLIFSYHGSLKSKLWFIPLGLLGIHAINILRIVILAIISNINNDWVDFNHKYVFNTVIYIFMFIMFTWWVRFVERQENKNKTAIQ